jgi:hypothetical protein
MMGEVENDDPTCGRCGRADYQDEAHPGLWLVCDDRGSHWSVCWGCASLILGRPPRSARPRSSPSEKS